ncbi:OmpA family protein [Marinobacterium sediminicola]|uniref:OmpA-OmpF porin, OOP family n=1 Tax=Marinobacterium sediminicola TaxID=518898 RepID=A0ABY1RZU5_9GAMM|nr:OmpA family protein [Marinobacterium sediminicola]ULG70017.1 OmpA family protein [Marinobacterium sediminicola]SMR74471.1 OmpA-OmpF porin, OOP family [Marinobacterium sediminicola]
MKKIAIAAGLAIALGASAAQAAVPGYATNSSDTIWRTSFGECWHTGFWTQEQAVEGCDNVMAKAEEPAPAPAPAAMADVEKKFALYFDFDSTQVGDVSNIVNYIGSLASLQSVKLVGYADFIGSAAYNEKLSERRARAVAAKLEQAGVDASKMAIGFMGESAPVANCTGRGAELIACLRPDRRVDVEIMGQKRVQQ